MKILEELWYEKIKPADVPVKPNRRYSRLTALADKNEKALRSLLSEEAKETFQKYTDSREEVVDMDELEIFLSGFRLGARIMLEVMQDEDIPTVDD